MHITDKRFPEEAWKAAEERRPFSFTITGIRSRIMRKSLHLYGLKVNTMPAPQASPGDNTGLLFRLYALLTPICWSVIFSAIRNGMIITSIEREQSITLYFAVV